MYDETSYDSIIDKIDISDDAKNSMKSKIKEIIDSVKYIDETLNDIIENINIPIRQKEQSRRIFELRNEIVSKKFLISAYKGRFDLLYKYKLSRLHVEYKSQFPYANERNIHVDSAIRNVSIINDFLVDYIKYLKECISTIDNISYNLIK